MQVTKLHITMEYVPSTTAFQKVPKCPPCLTADMTSGHTLWRRGWAEEDSCKERETWTHTAKLQTRPTYGQDGCHVLEVSVVCEVLVTPPVGLHQNLEPLTLHAGRCYTMLYVTQCYTIQHKVKTYITHNTILNTTYCHTRLHKVTR